MNRTLPNHLSGYIRCHFGIIENEVVVWLHDLIPEHPCRNAHCAVARFDDDDDADKALNVIRSWRSDWMKLMGITGQPILEHKVHCVTELCYESSNAYDMIYPMVRCELLHFLDFVHLRKAKHKFMTQ